MGVYIWSRLPSEYQEVEYIESSGTQYIDTGYVPGSNTEVEMKFKLMNRNTSVGIYLYGCRNGASGADRRSFNLELYNNKLAAHAYSNTGSYERIAYTINDISLDTLYTLKQNDYGLYLDGTLQGTFASHNSYTVQGYNMALFCGNVAGTWGSFTSLKVYSMTIKDSGILVRNFIPCYRKSDNVIGLYDLVNNQFYTNSGSGTFTKGSDVDTYRESLLKNAYIGEVWTPTSNTVCYYPFENDTLDTTGNTTISGTLTKDGLGYRPTANGQIDYPSGNYPKFLNYWLLIKQRPTSNTGCPFLDNPSTGYYPYHSNSSLNKKIWTFYNSSYASATVSFTPELNTWHNLSLGYDGTKMIYSIDGVSGTLYNGQGYGFANRIGWGAASGQYIISNLIAENTAWTSDQITNYYNTTKGNYGL